MKVSRILTVITFYSVTSFANGTDNKNQTDQLVSIAGSVQARSESLLRADFDGTSATPNKASSTSYRFRMDFTGNTDDFKFFFQPQLVKTAGEVNSSGSLTSGNTLDKEIVGHQAYVDFSIVENLNMRLGRQELAYGEHLILGSLPWNMTARSFDGVKLQLQNLGEHGRLDGFHTKIKDNNITQSRSKDYNFSGLYFQTKLGEIAQQFDLYLFDKAQTHLTNLEKRENLYTIGSRAKSKISNIDYRIEVTGQKGSDNSSRNVTAQQYEGELGYSLDFMRSRISIKYFHATKDYDQHFPTAHKFMGYADLFGRRNIKGHTASLSFFLTDKVQFIGDYHTFKRASTSDAAYKLNGTTSWGSIGNSSDIATEIDTLLIWNFKKQMDLELGHMIASSGKYIKDQNANAKDKAVFSYIMLKAFF